MSARSHAVGSHIVEAVMAGEKTARTPRFEKTRDGAAERNVIRRVRPLRSATRAINGAAQAFPPETPDDKQAILESLS